jgi:hypothetical protein
MRYILPKVILLLLLATPLFAGTVEIMEDGTSEGFVSRINVSTGLDVSRTGITGTVTAEAGASGGTLQTVTDAGSTTTNVIVAAGHDTTRGDFAQYSYWYEPTSAGDQYVGWTAPAALAASLVWKMPTTDAAGVMKSDGSLNTSFAAMTGAEVGLTDEFWFSAGTNAQDVIDDLDASIPIYTTLNLLPNAAILDDNVPPALSMQESTGVPRFCVAAFDASTDETIYWTFVAPADLIAGSWYADVLWSTNDVGAGETCYWQVGVSATTEGDADDVFEQAIDTIDSAYEAVNETEATRLISTTITITHTDGAAAGDLVTVAFGRDANNGSDNLSSDAVLHAVRLRIPR